MRRKTQVIHTIRDLIEYLIDNYKINQIPSSKTNRLDLERHFGRCEIIQNIIEVSETSESDLTDVPKITPLDFQKEPLEDSVEPLEDPIERMLVDKGLFPDMDNNN